MLRNWVMSSRYIGVGLLLIAMVGYVPVHAGQAGGQEAAVKMKGTTEAQRREYVTKAQVWDAEQYEKLKSLSPEQIKAGQPFENAFPFGQEITCRFIEPTLKNLVGGMTPKFLCGGGTDKDPCPECNVKQKELKVKYGKDPGANPELYAEVMGTRLMWFLGFKSDGDYPVRVKCLNCPADPWSVYKGFRDQAGGLDKDNPKDVEKAKKIAQGLGGSRSTRSFKYTVIESKYPGPKIKADDVDCKSSRAEADDPRCGGFSWNETKQISEAAGGATKAQIDAFKLLAAFMTHGDNKPGNQRLVCADENLGPDGKCLRPFAMIQDIGAGFGATAFLGMGYKKADIGAWDGRRLWADLHACRAKLSSTHELQDPVVSEEGRAFLAKLMNPDVLTNEKLTAIFEAARVAEKGDKFNGHPATAADWVTVFNKKRGELSQSCGTK